MKIVYAVEWIEVEFGSRPEGFKIFLDESKCTETTKGDSVRGSYGEGYLGPVRPLCYYEIPFDCLEEDVKTRLYDDESDKSRIFSSNYWSPKFKSSRIYIEN